MHYSSRGQSSCETKSGDSDESDVWSKMGNLVCICSVIHTKKHVEGSIYFQAYIWEQNLCFYAGICSRWAEVETAVIIECIEAKWFETESGSDSILNVLHLLVTLGSVCLSVLESKWRAAEIVSKIQIMSQSNNFIIF